MVSSPDNLIRDYASFILLCMFPFNLITQEIAEVQYHFTSAKPLEADSIAAIHIVRC